jgi:hypothetical protein
MIKREGKPREALRKVLFTDTLALSRPVEDELLEVLSVRASRALSIRNCARR